DNPLSVATGRSMEAIAAERDRVWDSQHGGEITEAPKPAKKSALAGAHKRAMPDKLVPQLASQADSAPDGPAWLHESKSDGYDLTGAVLEDRKAALAEIVPRQAGMVRYSDHQEGHGPDFFRHACRYRLEGTVAKRRDRPYRPGRSAEWRKIKCAKRDEFVVIG